MLQRFLVACIWVAATCAGAGAQGTAKPTVPGSATASSQASAKLSADGALQVDLPAEGLAALLANVEFDHQLGLDEMQFLAVMEVIERSQFMMEMSLLMDPTMNDPETIEMIGWMNWFRDLQLWFILTPDQQQKLQQWLELGATETQNGTSGTAATGTKQSTSRSATSGVGSK